MNPGPQICEKRTKTGSAAGAAGLPAEGTRLGRAC